MWHRLERHEVSRNLFHSGRIGRIPLRWHQFTLVAWAALWIPTAELHRAISWHYFRTGEQLLFNGMPGGGLALYANHPELQIGPVSFLTAAAFAPFRFHTGEELADAFMSVLGLRILMLIGGAAADHYRGTGTHYLHLQRCLLVAGSAFTPMWVEVAVRYGHLDDVLALLFTTLAVHALIRGRAPAVGVFLALAIDSKPWAVGFLPLLLAVPRSARLRPATLLTALVAAAWLPFYLSHPNSTAAARFTIRNHPASALRWLGVHTVGTPWWDRPAQMALGIILGSLAIRRGRWPAIVLLAMDARILLDPGVHTYYNASVLLGAVIWDVLGEHRRVPWVSWSALVALYGAELLIPSDAARGFVRLAYVVASAAYVLYGPRRIPRPIALAMPSPLDLAGVEARHNSSPQGPPATPWVRGSDRTPPLAPAPRTAVIPHHGRSGAMSYITVLLVDNHQDTRVALKAALAPLPCRTATAECGTQALKTVLRGGIDLVLLEVAMPGMTGIEVARYLHHLDKTRHIPVILMTGLVGHAHLTEEAFEIGVADIVVKPVPPWLLRLKVASHLRYLTRIRELTAPNPD